MLSETAQHIAETDTLAHAAEHASTHGGGGSDFIMHHIMAHPVFQLAKFHGIDFSITNHIIMMLISSILLIILFLLAFRKKNNIPHGLSNILESIVDYVLKDAIYPNLGKENKQYAPYLLTAFFFILISNLLGLVPFGVTATGNISVTLTLALFTLVIGQMAGIKKFGIFTFYKHLIPSGLPILLIPIMIPVELVSLLAKHLSLAIRLFANMIGGHITTLAIMSIIFIFQKAWVIPFPLILIIFINLLELLIAFIQAYVFTTLSAVFIGTSLSEEH